MKIMATICANKLAALPGVANSKGQSMHVQRTAKTKRTTTEDGGRISLLEMQLTSHIPPHMMPTVIGDESAVNIHSTISQVGFTMLLWRCCYCYWYCYRYGMALLPLLPLLVVTQLLCLNTRHKMGEQLHGKSGKYTKTRVLPRPSADTMGDGRETEMTATNAAMDSGWRTADGDGKGQGGVVRDGEGQRGAERDGERQRGAGRGVEGRVARSGTEKDRSVSAVTALPLQTDTPACVHAYMEGRENVPTQDHHSATPQRTTRSTKNLGDSRKTAGGRSVGDGVVLVHTDTHACVRTDNAYSGRRGTKTYQHEATTAQYPTTEELGESRKAAAGGRSVGPRVVRAGGGARKHTNTRPTTTTRRPTHKQRIGR